MSLVYCSVRRQLKPYQVLDSPANQYVHVALNGSVTLWYRRNSSVGGNVRLMSWAIMPFHRAIPKNDARYSQIWDRDKSTTTLRLTKIDEIILKQSFRAVANVYPIRLTTTSGTVHLLKESASNKTIFVKFSVAILCRGLYTNSGSRASSDWKNSAQSNCRSRKPSYFPDSP